jgi:hypothetical protein
MCSGYGGDAVGRAVVDGVARTVCMWRKPVGPRASCTVAKSTTQGPRDVGLPRRASTAVYGGGRRGAGAMSRAWVCSWCKNCSD